MLDLVAKGIASNKDEVFKDFNHTNCDIFGGDVSAGTMLDPTIWGLVILFFNLWCSIPCKLCWKYIVRAHTTYQTNSFKNVSIRVVYNNPRQIDTSFSKFPIIADSSSYFFLHCLSPETLFPFPLYLYVEKRLQDFDHFRFQWLSLCQVKPSQSLYSKHLFNFKYWI